MDLKNNMIGWFEIPVNDLNRAINFYKEVFCIDEMHTQDFGEVQMAFFPWDEKVPGSPGGLVHYPTEYKPSESGVLIYFNSIAGDLNEELGRIEGAGGKVLMPKKLIADDIGYMALFLDTEGNRIALHSRI
nr:VOC family protein [uncultured Carboxylicivirga sp.]